MAFEMRLDRLELTNFHQFERYGVDFDEHLTVLVGDNGSGKSSILAAASVALGTFIYGVGRVSRCVISRSDSRISTFDMDGVIDRQEQYPVTVSAWGTVGEPAEKVSWSRRLSSADAESKPFEGAQQLWERSNSCQQRIQNGDMGLVLPVIACYGTGRLWAKSSHGSAGNRHKSFSRQDGYEGALDAHADEEQMLSWFFKMTAQDVQRSQSIKPMEESALFAAVRGAVEKCFELITGSSQVRVTYNFDTDDLDVEYLAEDGEVRQMSMSLLSDGYRTTLSTFADIAYRMAVLNPMLGERVLETPGVVLIDEIDLHLHPLWQARILGDLREVFPNVQFIVTTHAPVVVSSARAKNIRLLEGGEEAQKLSGEIYGSDAGRVLISVMGSPERPTEIQNRFNDFYRVLDVRDFERARGMLADLESEIGSDDADLAAAQTSLGLEEAEARYDANQ